MNNNFFDSGINYPWIPLTPVEKMEKSHYDVLIVGTGAGGGAALWRLCDRFRRSGGRIGVVEAGDLLLPTHSFNLPTFNEQRAIAYSDHVAKPLGRRWPNFAGAKAVQGLGGRTIQWYTFSPRFEPSAFWSWPITYRELVPYYVTAEKVMSVTPFYTARSALQDIFLERLRLGGFPEAADLPIAADLNVTQNGQVHSNVFFSSIIFLAYALNIGTFDLAVRTRAVKVLTQNGKAVGVKVISPDMKTYSLTANTIVVSAGPWETPRLLLASGIPGEAIGRYLVHHSQYSADAFVYREQFPEVLGVAMLYVPGSAEREYQLVAFTEFFYKYMEIPLRQTVKINLRGYGVVEPRRENGVSLDISQKDAFGVPLLNVQFSHSDKDRAILRQISATLLALSAAMKLTMETAPQLEPPGIDNHEAGTCRMGNDPFTSATNRFGQIHGVTGLYIADNSVLNMTSPANPTLTTIALAMRTADHIVEQLK